MRALSAPVQRFAALGLLVLVVLVAYAGIVQPLRDSYAAARADAATMQAAIAKAEASLAAAGDLRKQLADLTAQARNANGFLPAASDALASASLQDYVKGAVDKVHGELRSMQILTARDEGSVRRIAVRAQFTADLAGIQKVFYELESMPAILLLNNVQISRQPAPAGGKRTGAAPLEVQFDIVGYMRGAGAIGAGDWRRRGLIASLAAICVVLAAIVGEEWRHGLWSVSPPGAPPATAAAPAAAGEAAMPALSTYAEVLSRPLFSPTRRPEEIAPPPTTPTQMTLVAILISKRGPHALVRHGQPPTLDLVVEGQIVEGWTAEAIKDDRVIFRRGDDTMELVPASAAQPRSPGSPVVPPAPGAAPLPPVRGVAPRTAG